MTHETRLRQLLTNYNHARLAYGRVIREYQFDSPSRSALFSGPWLSRDGPNKMANYTTRGLTGSFISVLGRIWGMSCNPFMTK